MFIHLCLFLLSSYSLSISHSNILAKFQRRHDSEGMPTPFDLLLWFLNLRKTIIVSLPFIHPFICISIHCRSIYLLVLPSVCSFAHQSVYSHVHSHMSFSVYHLSISQSYLLAKFQSRHDSEGTPTPFNLLLRL
jgi:hypothetical protein